VNIAHKAYFAMRKVRLNPLYQGGSTMKDQPIQFDKWHLEAMTLSLALSANA